MSAGPLELRALLAVAAAALLFTLLTPIIYRRDPARRRLYLAVLAAVLLVAPWWGALGAFTWPLGLHETPPVLLAQPVPWLFVAVWWGVAAIRMTRVGGLLVRQRRALQALPAFPDAALQRECRRIAVRLGLERPVTLRLGPTACASSLAGHVVLLPPAARSWGAATRSAVLAHELAHLARKDDRQMLLVRLLVDWYWWMPWLEGLYRRYLEAMEESCDDRASALLPGRPDYVEGLVQAARSLADGGSDRGSLPAWVTLFGHSHLSVRAERLLAAPRPTLDHADGRWVLFWGCLLFGLLLTAEPAAVPEPWPDGARLIPLMPAPAGRGGPDAAAPPRVETVTLARHPATGVWHRLAGSARDPLPVYPAEALARGLGGTVTVELELRRTPAGLVRWSSPRITSSDASGVLTDAVRRALRHAADTWPEAGLRAVPASRHDTPFSSLRPGTRLRLKQIYRFTAGTAAPANATIPAQENPP